MKLVKVGRVGKKIVEVALNDNATIGNAMEAAGLYQSLDEDVYLNHIARTDLVKTHPVMSGDVIILEKKKIIISEGMKRLIDFLIDYDLVEACYVDDNDYDGNSDYAYMLRENRGLIEDIKKFAREAV